MTEDDAPAEDQAAVAGLGERSDVVDALGRVLASPSFSKSVRSRAFLSFVVSETLAGRGNRLSERTVARGGLGRGPSFDGMQDSSVRVSATRVRRALDRYYATDGADDALRITLPPGSYVPVVESNTRLPQRYDLEPGVVVLTPEHRGDDSARVLAASTADSLVQSLQHYDALVVVGPTSARRDAAEAGRRAGVSHVLAGSVIARDGVARLTARLLASVDGAVVWSESFEHTDDLVAFDVEDRWGQEVAARIADHGGVVVGDVMARSTPETAPGVRARLAYFAYIDRTTKESIQAAALALDEALVATRTAPLLAMRGAVANAAVLQGIGDVEADTELAERLAREALTRDGGNAHAYLVLGGAARTRHRWAQCRQFAEEAYRRAPTQPVNVLSAGLLLESAGEWAAGMALVERGLVLNPRMPVHARLWLALGHVVLEQYDRALAEATLIDVDGEIFGPLYRALALSGLGLLGDAGRDIERVLAIDPEFLDDAGERFTTALNLSDEEVARIVGLLDRAAPRPGTPVSV